jgi:hypothetical protein
LETVGIWLLILLILAITFGPVYWFRPSARERRIGRMRQHAIVRGIQVELVRLVDTEPEPSARVTAGGVLKEPAIACTAYRLLDHEAMRSSDADLYQAPHWRIRRTALDVPGPVPGWRWDATAPGFDDVTLHGDARYWKRAGPLVARMPDDAVGIEAAPLAVACYWRERADADTAIARVDSLIAALGELLDLQRETRVKLRTSGRRR